MEVSKIILGIQEMEKLIPEEMINVPVKINGNEEEFHDLVVLDINDQIDQIVGYHWFKEIQLCRWEDDFPN